MKKERSDERRKYLTFVNCLQDSRSGPLSADRAFRVTANLPVAVSGGPKASGCLQIIQPVV